MTITWDENKRQTNLSNHGMDFADLDVEFFANALVRPTHSSRLVTFGEFRGEVIIALCSSRSAPRLFP
jgi:uncharacterized DUF497 family protein